MTGHESAVATAATAAPPSLILLNQLGRSLSSLFTQCAAPGHQVIVLSIDDITSGDGEYLLDVSSSNKKGMSSSSTSPNVYMGNPYIEDGLDVIIISI